MAQSAQKYAAAGYSGILAQQVAHATGYSLDRAEDAADRLSAAYDEEARRLLHEKLNPAAASQPAPASDPARSPPPGSSTAAPASAPEVWEDVTLDWYLSFLDEEVLATLQSEASQDE